MNARTKLVLAEALELAPDERAVLAEELLASLHGAPDPKAERAWTKVIERRGLGVDFALMVDAVIEKLQEMPTLGTPMPDVPRELRARRVLLPRFPHA